MKKEMINDDRQCWKWNKNGRVYSTSSPNKEEEGVCVSDEKKTENDDRQ